MSNSPLMHPALAGFIQTMLEVQDTYCDVDAMLEEANLTADEAADFLTLFVRTYPEAFVQEHLVRWLEERKKYPQNWLAGGRRGKRAYSYPAGTCSTCGAPPDWKHKQGSECIMCNKPWHAVPGVYVPPKNAQPESGWCSHCGAAPIQTAGNPEEPFCAACGEPWVSFIPHGPWTDADQKAALKEGWGLFFTSPHSPMRIERNDALTRFKTDAMAEKWVRYNAKHYGSPSGMRAKKALAIIDMTAAMNDSARSANHVLRKGEYCPVCGADSTHMTGELPVMGDGEAGVCTQEVTCSHCGAAWEDTYTLSSMRILEEDPHFMNTEQAAGSTTLKLSGDMRVVPIAAKMPLVEDAPAGEQVHAGDHTVILDADDLPAAVAQQEPPLYMNVVKALLSQRFTEDDYRMLIAMHRQYAQDRALFCMVGDSNNGWFLYMGDEPEENAEMLDLCRRIFSPDFCAEIEMAMRDTDVEWLRVPGTDVDDTPSIGAPQGHEHCKICGRVMDVPGDPTSVNRGGDCTRCMAEAGDPDARIAMHAHTGDQKWQPDPEDYTHTK